jgi:hypothetical protein
MTAPQTKEKRGKNEMSGTKRIFNWKVISFPNRLRCEDELQTARQRGGKKDLAGGLEREDSLETRRFVQMSFLIGTCLPARARRGRRILGDPVGQGGFPGKPPPAAGGAALMRITYAFQSSVNSILPSV